MTPRQRVLRGYITWDENYFITQFHNKTPNLIIKRSSKDYVKFYSIWGKYLFNRIFNIRSGNYYECPNCKCKGTLLQSNRYYSI